MSRVSRGSSGVLGFRGSRARRRLATAAALLSLLLPLNGCARLVGRLHVFPRCADGLPPLVLVHEGCPPDGVCGYSCAPGRWRDRAAER